MPKGDANVTHLLEPMCYVYFKTLYGIFHEIKYNLETMCFFRNLVCSVHSTCSTPQGVYKVPNEYIQSCTPGYQPTPQGVGYQPTPQGVGYQPTPQGVKRDIHAW